MLCHKMIYHIKSKTDEKQHMNHYLKRWDKGVLVFFTFEYLICKWIEGTVIPFLPTIKTQKQEADICIEYKGYLPNATLNFAPYLKIS